MELTKLISIFGWSCLLASAALIFAERFAGSALFFVQEDKPQETMAITQQKDDSLQKEKMCLKEALYAEARNTSRLEQQSIAEVILNRTKHKDYPSTICGVIQQPWQFSFKNRLQDRTQNILPELHEINSNLDKQAYLQIESVVDDVLTSGNKILPENAIFYHTKKIKKKPVWAKSKNIRKIKLDNGFKHTYYLAMD